MTTRADTMSGDPFGSRRRDWTFLWRTVVLIFGIFSTGGISIILYAGTQYIRDQAAAVVSAQTAALADAPAKIKQLEDAESNRRQVQSELWVWRAKKDEIDTRLTTLLENQQAMLLHQQVQIDRLNEHSR